MQIYLLSATNEFCLNIGGGAESIRAIKFYNICVGASVTRLGDLFDFGHLFKAFGNN